MSFEEAILIDKEIFRRQINTVESVYEEWEELVISGKFLPWQHGQPPEVQALVQSPDPKDSIQLIDLYYSDVNPSKWIH